MRLIVGTLIVVLSVLLTWWLARSPAPIVGQPVVLGDVEWTAAVDGGEPLSEAGTDAATQAELPHPHPLTSAACPEGMLYVAGDFCALPGQRRCRVETQHLGFCMDRFEYPNQEGVLPAVMLRFDQAQQWCRLEGKRLCTEAEWTFACRSVRRPSSCQVGLLERTVPVERLWDPERISSELAERDGRRRSQASECVNEFGVFDLIGNVQEWVVRPNGAEAGLALLKGGPYNQRGASCDRALQITQLWSRYPHTGFRCCSAPLVEVPAGH